MNVNETCSDCGKNYVITRADALKECPHCSSSSNQASEETLEIRKRLKLIREKEEKQNPQHKKVCSEKPAKEKNTSLWKKLTSRLNK